MDRIVPETEREPTPGRPCEMMTDVPVAIRVWAVDLSPGSSLKEREGELTLSAEVLRFTPSKEGAVVLEIPLREVTKARRLRGSPVLLVARSREGAVDRTAFYFVQPPPLTAYTGAPTERTSLATLRNPRRKARRQNVGYLGIMNRSKKAALVEWERAVRAAVGHARKAAS